MGLFDRLVLFSEVRGTVLKNGEPVQGAEVLQKVVWSDDPDEIAPQRVLADAKGRFELPAIERRAVLHRVLPGQPMMLQTLVIRYDGTEYLAWRYGKDSYDANSELDGRPLKLICELTRQPAYDGKRYGICKVA